MISDWYSRFGFGRSFHFGDVFLESAEISAQSQIEVAIEQIPVPRHRNQGSAHQALDGTWVEALGKPLLIAIEVTGFLQPRTEPAKGNIGKSEQIIEYQSVFSFQIVSESLFRLGLGRRQEGSGGAGYEIQFQTCSGLPVPEIVEFPQHRDACIHDALASLGISLGGLDRG